MSAPPKPRAAKPKAKPKSPAKKRPPKRVKTKPATPGQISVALWRARLDTGMTLDEVCAQVSFTRSAVIRCEKGTDNNLVRMRQVAVALCLVYGIEPASVLERPDE